MTGVAMIARCSRRVSEALQAAVVKLQQADTVCNYKTEQSADSKQGKWTQALYTD